MEKLGKKQRTRSQIGKSSRNKGATFERKIANTLKDRGFEARRAVQFNGVFDHDIATDIPFNFECKSVESLNIQNAMEQSRADSRVTKRIATVVHKKNNKATLLTLDFQDFMDLLQWALGHVDSKNTMDLKEIREVYIERMRNIKDSELL